MRKRFKDKIKLGVGTGLFAGVLSLVGVSNSENSHQVLEQNSKNPEMTQVASGKVIRSKIRGYGENCLDFDEDDLRLKCLSDNESLTQEEVNFIFIKAREYLKIDENRRTQKQKDLIYYANQMGFSTIENFREMSPIEKLNKKIVMKLDLNSDDLSLLEEKAKEFEAIPVDRRTSLQKNVIYTNNNFEWRRVYLNYRKEVKELYYKRPITPQLDILDNVRYQNKSYDPKNRMITFSQINPSFLKLVLNYSRKYDLPPKLVLTILLKENNFGNNFRSSADARGPMQMKDEVSAGYIEGFMNFGEGKKDELSLEAGFMHLAEIRNKNLLNLHYDKYDEIDLLVAMGIYYQGVKEIILSEGRIKKNSGLYNYIVKGTSSLDYAYNISLNDKIHLI